MPCNVTTPLYHAIGSKDWSMAKYLILLGADRFALRYKDWNGFVHAYGSSWLKPEIAKQLDRIGIRYPDNITEKPG